MPEQPTQCNKGLPPIAKHQARSAVTELSTDLLELGRLVVGPSCCRPLQALQPRWEGCWLERGFDSSELRHQLGPRGCRLLAEQDCEKVRHVALGVSFGDASLARAASQKVLSASCTNAGSLQYLSVSSSTTLGLAGSIAGGVGDPAVSPNLETAVEAAGVVNIDILLRNGLK